MKPYIAKIPMPPYGAVLFVYLDPETYVKHRGIDEEFAKSAGGITSYTEDRNEFHVLIADPTINVLTHEILHVVINLFRHRGIVLSSKSEESWTYFMGWLTNEVYNAICKHKSKVNKATPEESGESSTKVTPEAEGAGVKQGAQP